MQRTECANGPLVRGTCVLKVVGWKGEFQWRRTWSYGKRHVPSWESRIPMNRYEKSAPKSLMTRRRERASQRCVLATCSGESTHNRASAENPSAHRIGSRGYRTYKGMGGTGVGIGSMLLVIAFLSMLLSSRQVPGWRRWGPMRDEFVCEGCRSSSIGDERKEHDVVSEPTSRG
jgi:hypothetical protein